MELPFSLMGNTTLNEKFGIQAGIAPAVNVVPNMTYWAIGNGGHVFTTGANGLTKPEPIQHSGEDAALYNHLPFVLRATTNDLQTVDQTKYALRKVVTYNSVQYFAYYLKRIVTAGILPAMDSINVANGVTVVTPFVASSANLNPTPPTLSSSGVNIVAGNYAAASALLTLSLSESDVTELLNAAQIIYGDPGYAIISEIALCSGVDKVVTSPGVGSGTINFNESIATQIVSFVNTFSALQYNTNGINISLDVGATEPLFSSTTG